MSQVVEQTELALARRPDKVSVAIEIIRAQKTSGAAFTLACSTSGLDDKEIYMALTQRRRARIKPDDVPKTVDAGYFTNMKKGKATLDMDMLADFCAVVDNTIYPEWLAYQIGCTLVMIQTEAERRAERAEQRAKTAEDKLDFLTKVVQGKAA